MNYPNIFDRIRPWLKPGLTTLLGMILLFRPDSVTAVLACVIGFAVSLAGCGLLVSFFFGSRRQDGLKLAAAIILMVIGFSIVKYPLSLARQMGRFIGVLLVLQSARELIGQYSPKSKVMSAVTGIVGIFLMLVPLSGSRLLFSGCGIVVLVMGIGMLLEVWQNTRQGGGSRDDIIDQR